MRLKTARKRKIRNACKRRGFLLLVGNQGIWTRPGLHPGTPFNDMVFFLPYDREQPRFYRKYK